MVRKRAVWSAFIGHWRLRQTWKFFRTTPVAPLVNVVSYYYCSAWIVWERRRQGEETVAKHFMLLQARGPLWSILLLVPQSAVSICCAALPSEWRNLASTISISRLIKDAPINNNSRRSDRFGLVLLRGSVINSRLLFFFLLLLSKWRWVVQNGLPLTIMHVR